AAGGAEQATLARHWDAGGRADPAALAHLAAAEAAERVHAPVAAHAHWQRVLALWDLVSDPVRADLGDRGARLAQAAETAYLAGDFSQAVDNAEEGVAATRDDPAARAVRLERLARYRWVARDGPGADAAYQEAVRTMPPDAPDAIRAQILAGYAWVLTMSFRSEQARPMAEEALEAANRSGDDLARCRALLAWGYERDPDALAEACDLAIALDAGDEAARGWLALDLTLRARGLAGQRLDVLDKGMAYAESLGLERSYRKLLSVYRAEALFDLGRWDEAGDVLDRLRAEEPQGMLAYFSTAQRVRLAAGRGRVEQAHREAEHVVRLGTDIPQQPFPAEVAQVAAAEAHLWDDRPDLALDVIGRLFASPVRDAATAAEGVATGVRAAADLCEQAAFAGDRGAADAARAGIPDLLARLPDDDQPRLRAWAATAAAEASRAQAGSDPDPWRAAVAAWDEAEGPYPGAYARWRLARALLASRSGRREAAEALSQALEVAARVGAPPLAHGIEKLAAGARLRLRSSAVDEPDEAAAARAVGLTPREFEILPLLAAGRTNREIADALFISPRTVGVHVSRVLHKLEISRRAEVAETARRRGLIGSAPT
ncbi:MAG TPA: response regulator transcription factor, partial [Egibacteraceae bacterium]|nr:response regulator transcription factor [Egibacteraceae bacterium]